MFFKKFEKSTKRVTRKVEVEENMVRETWDAFHSIGVPVTYFQYVEESDADESADRITYLVTVDASQDEWDRLNRKLGALGIIDAAEN